MSKPASISRGRYQLKSVLGKGGMGIVYKAYDTTTEREVSLKTINDVTDRATLDLFQQEYSRQKSLTHPNIVDIYDIGELEDNGERRPYFTMPLLHGKTLEDLIRDSSHRLSVERVIDIACQVCRGLQAAHDAGLVHRDIKPGNIFVLEDDAVKILDFGISHLIDKHSTMGFKGTLMYMTPEQLKNQKPTPLSDIFSLAGVCYEALTRRRPFEGANREEIVEAILNRSPVPACELNPAVNWPLSQVLHAAMAKEPWRRFAAAREFSDALQKAMRGEPIERFNHGRIQPRMERARKAFQDEEYDYAVDILAELESECWIDPEIVGLRREVDAVRREREIRRLLEAASLRHKDEDYPLALQKIDEVLRLDPQHPDALALRDKIETQHRSQKIDGWFLLARRHIENHTYEQARSALQNVLQVNPNDSAAKRLLGDIDRHEQEHLKQRQLKQQLYDAALQEWQRGEVTNALTKLERLLELDRSSPEHQGLYNQVRSAHDALKSAHDEVRQHLQNRNFQSALELCDLALGKYPQNTLFQALKFDAEAGQRQELSDYIARVDREVEKEPDVDRKVGLLEAALERFPVDHFRQSLKLVRARRDLVNSIVEKARAFEAKGQLAEAVGQLEILRNIDSQYPGLAFELERLQRRREQHARSESKTKWVEQIERSIGLGEYGRALELAERGIADFPGDAELTALAGLARQGLERSAQAGLEFEHSKKLYAQGQPEESLNALRRAHELDERNGLIRSSLIEYLLMRARATMDTDWRKAEPFLAEALTIDPGNSAAKSLRLMVEDHQRAEGIEQCLTQAKASHAAGDIPAALAHVDRGLATYPTEPRLLQLRATLIGGGNTTVAVPSSAQRAAAAAEKQDSKAPPPTVQQSPREKSERRKEPDPPAKTNKQASARKPVRPGVGAQAMKALMTMGAGVLFVCVWVAGKVATVASKPGAPAATAPAAAGKTHPRHLVRRPWAIALAGVLLVAGSALVKVLWRQDAKPPTAESVQVRFETEPRGATLYVGGKQIDASSPLQLAPGTHTFKAVLDGYHPAEETVTLAAGSRDPVRFTLIPLLPAMRIVSNLSAGRASIDGQPPIPFEGSQLAIDTVPEGQREVKITGENGAELVLAFQIEPGKAPRLTTPLAPKEMIAVAVTSYLGKARIHSSFAPVKLAVDDQPAGDVGADGLEISLTPGVHKLSFGEGKAQRDFSIDVGLAPSLSAGLSLDRNVGTLEIVGVNEVDFSAFIDDKPAKVTRTRQGRLYVYDLEPRFYNVRIEHNDYEPGRERVEIQKGRIGTATFKLAPRPRFATLSITGGPAGASVTIEGVNHKIGGDGSLSVTNVNPGKRKVAVKAARDEHKPWEKEYEFVAGKSVELRPGDIVLDKIAAQGFVELKVEPAGAQVSYRPAAGGQSKTVPGTKFELPEGSYTFHGTAVDHMPRDTQVNVVRGKPTTVSLILPPVERVALKKYGISDWSGRWEQRDKWHVRKGGGPILYNATPTGIYEFTAMRMRRLRAPHVKWVVNYKDARNYEEFDIDPDELVWKRVVDGKELPEKSQKHNVKITKDTYILRVSIGPGVLKQAVYDGTAFRDLPGLRPADISPAAGKFGFRFGENEELFLSGFSFTPSNR